MAPAKSPRRTRVERGVYRQPNGSFARRRGWIVADPVELLEPCERPRPPRRSRGRVLGQAEIGRLLDACPARGRLLVETALYSGLRISELLGLIWEDVDFAALRFHDLRHTFASHLIVDLALDVAQVSRIMGHARITITLDVYTHLFDDARHAREIRQRMAASRFASLLDGEVSEVPASILPLIRQGDG